MNVPLPFEDHRSGTQTAVESDLKNRKQKSFLFVVARGSEAVKGAKTFQSKQTSLILSK